MQNTYHNTRLWTPGALLLLTLLATTLLAPDLYAEGWPRNFSNADGSSIRLTAPPQRILSTSVTITGTLLAMDAPVVASASSANGQFFDQWAELATRRGLENLWPAGSIDLEAAYATAPDLIVISVNGADSALEQRQALSQIAPVILLDYGALDWQALALQLGQAIGLEPQAHARIAAFEKTLTEARSRIRLPAGKANIVSYNGPGIANPIATAEGTHGRLLSALGFRIESPDPAWHSGAGEPGDFVRSEYAYLTRLKAPTTFLLRSDAQDVSRFRNDPVLANLPSVRTGQVYGLGLNSFRIDYFSANEVVAELVAALQP